MASNETVKRSPSAQRERVPLVRHYLRVGAGELLSLVPGDAVAADVVFERVGAHDVVIVEARQP
jgi:hypothetical protein